MSAFGSRQALLVLAAGASVMAVTLGIRHGFGLFLQPMSVANGWSRETFALAIAMQNLIWGIAQPFTGLIADRFGAARVIVVGSVLYACGLIVMASAHTPGELMLGAGLLVGLGLSGTTFAVVLGAVSRAVSASQRTMAMGIATGIGSFGQFVFLPGSLALLDSLGWSGALLALAGIAAATALLARGVRPPAPETSTRHEMGSGAALREAFAQRDFWLLAAGFFVCGFHVVFITTHVPAFLLDRGLPLGLGTTVLALLGLANVAGAWLGGVWGQQFRKPLVLSAIYVGRAVVIAAFVWLPISSASACIFAIVLGLLWMSTVPLTNGTLATVFGVRNLSLLSGIVFFFHQLGAFLGGWLGGRIHDATGNYDIVWSIAIGLSLVAALLNLPIRERPVNAPRLVGASS